MLKLSRNEKLAHATIYLLLILLTLAFLIPFIIVFSTSSSAMPNSRAAAATCSTREEFSMGAYDILFGRSKVILNAYGVTLFRVVVGTGFNLAFTITMAYALAKRDLPGRVPLTIFVFITMVSAAD